MTTYCVVIIFVGQMGVNDFNTLVITYGRRLVGKRKFDKIIIDASNLFHRYLSAVLAELKRTYGTFELFGGIKATLPTQAAYVVVHTFSSITMYINKLLRQYSPKQIYLVLDPLGEGVEYIIDGNSEFIDKDYIHILFPNYRDGEHNVRSVCLKENEQRKRAGVNEIEKGLERIKGYWDKSDEGLDDETVSYLDEQLRHIVKDTLYLSSQHNVIGLARALLSLLTKEFKSKSDTVIFVRAYCEADLLIKNLANEPVPTLVISADTDYYFILSDFEHCYCMDVKSGSPIYSPKELWMNMLEDAYSYDIIIRLSPLFGNDYTVHKGIIGAKNGDDVIKFMNIHGDIGTIMLQRRKTVSKVLLHSKQLVPDGVMTPKIIDEIIRHYDVEYFKTYYESVVVYKHWQTYNDYKILKEEPLVFPCRVDSCILFDPKDVEEANWSNMIMSVKAIGTFEEIFTGEVEGFMQELTQPIMTYTDFSEYYDDEPETKNDNEDEDGNNMLDYI